MTISTLLIVFGSAMLVIAAALGHRRERKREAAEVKRIGSAFEVDLVATRLQQVRRDYIAAVHFPLHRSSCRAQLVRTARRAFARLGYFESRKEDLHERSGIVT